MIPGLLQTEAYARAMLALGGEPTVDEVEGRWETVTAEALPLGQSTRLIMEVAKTWT